MPSFVIHDEVRRTFTVDSNIDETKVGAYPIDITSQISFWSDHTKTELVNRRSIE